MVMPKRKAMKSNTGSLRGDARKLVKKGHKKSVDKKVGTGHAVGERSAYLNYVMKDFKKATNG